MCKPSTVTDIDPNTGLTYRSEIDSAITGAGFTPPPNLQVEDGQGRHQRRPDRSVHRDGIGYPGIRLGPDGLSASKYNVAHETFNPVNTDTDNSAVSGTYSGVENGKRHPRQRGQPARLCRWATCPITESTDASSGGS